MSPIGIGLLVLLGVILAGLFVFFVVIVAKKGISCGCNNNESVVAADQRRFPHTNVSLKNSGVDDVLVISLDNSKRWTAQVQPQMRAAGFGKDEYGVWRGVNGWTLSRQDLKDVLSPQTFYKLHCDEQHRQNATEEEKEDEGVFSRGAVGCALSHIGIWKYVVAHPQVRAVLVLEDDVAFDSRVSDAPRRIAKLIEYAGGVETFDMIRLDGNESPRQHRMCAKMEKSHTPFLHRCMGMYYSFGSYIITKRGARALLKHCLPIETHIDNLPSFVTELNRTADGDSGFVCYVVPRQGRFVRQNRALPSFIRRTAG